jgi:iron(III) transport system ATP-binding protein
VIKENEFICLLGPSGCGKTTTLRCLAGLERPDAGRIRIGGRDVFDSSSRKYVPTERRGIGMVFQSYAIWPHMSVFDNVAYPLRRGAGREPLSREKIRQRVRHILETVDCAELETRRPGELSGGQQQRVALARALVYEPKVLLFDEPLSNLDAKLRERMRFELRMIQERAGFTAVYVTHDQEEALTLSDRIAVMAKGKIRQIGTPEEVYELPVDGFVADFIGAANIIPVQTEPASRADAVPTPLGVMRIGSRSVALDSADATGTSGEADLQVVVRPERVRLLADGDSRTENVFGAVVLGRAYRGESLVYTLHCNDVQLRAVVRDTTRLEVGDEVTVQLPPEHCRLVEGGGFKPHNR